MQSGLLTHSEVADVVRAMDMETGMEIEEVLMNLDKNKVGIDFQTFKQILQVLQKFCRTHFDVRYQMIRVSCTFDYIGHSASCWSAGPV